MKSATLCLILILSTACQQGICSFIKQNEDMDSAAELVNPHMETADIQESTDFLLRHKRHVGLHMCIWCCNCCKNKGCGYCCRT